MLPEAGGIASFLPVPVILGDEVIDAVRPNPYPSFSPGIELLFLPL